MYCMEVTIMALAAADMNRRDELLHRLKNVWNDLSNEERSAVEVVVNSIILTHKGALEEVGEAVDEAVFTPLSETELFERIDRSLAQADVGEYMDAEAFEKEIEAEFGLV